MLMKLKYMVMSRPKFYSGMNLEQNEVRECLLSFSENSLGFLFATRKYTD